MTRWVADVATMLLEHQRGLANGNTLVVHVMDDGTMHLQLDRRGSGETKDACSLTRADQEWLRSLLTWNGRPV